MLILLILLLFPPLVLGQAQQYDKTVPTTKGLRGWWTTTPGFTGGPLWYDMLGRHHITLANMSVAGTTSGWSAGTLMNSVGEVRFDGTNDLAVTAPSSTYLYPSPFTITLWIKRAAIGNNYQALMNVDGSSRELFMRSSGKLDYNFLGTSYGYGHGEGFAVLAVGTWYHVAWSYSNIGRVYVNCVEDFNDSGGGAGTPFPINNVVRFGNKSDFSEPFPGVINHIRIYDRILPPREICQVMKDDLVKPVLRRNFPTESFLAFILGKFGSFFFNR